VLATPVRKFTFSHFKYVDGELFETGLNAERHKAFINVDDLSGNECSKRVPSVRRSMFVQ
jgi:hypothetical protein